MRDCCTLESPEAIILQVNRTFKKAPRAKGKKAEQEDLGLT